MGDEKGKKVFRLRGEYRAIFTFDGEVVKFTRFRPRRRVEYGRLPKASWGVSKTSAQSESRIGEVSQSMNSWSVANRHRCLSDSYPGRSGFP